MGTPHTEVEYAEHKLAELMLYVAFRSEGDPHFGAVKLNKLLFYADFFAYLKFGQPITGARYLKREHGPVPSPLPAVKSALAAAGAAVERAETLRPGMEQKRLVAMREPNIDVFSAHEIALVDGVITRFWDLTASEIRDRSHEFPGWDLAAMGEEIPYFTALLPKEPIPMSPAERAYGLEVARRLAADLGGT